ncbi:MAG: hypothetical protein LUD74_04880 [Tannerellaceae bacterium]|nr:hypothetical protein [Tannerellaceae bacterium]
MNIKTLAGIDIGTNAIRMLVSNVDMTQRYPDFKKVTFIRVPIRLGEDVFTNGKVSAGRKQLLLETMDGFAHLLRAYQINIFKACATSAMRDASNGREIVEEIARSCGLQVDIISGCEEADMIYEAGGLKPVMDKNRNYLYMDVGGGSTEVILYGDKQKINSHSFQLGTVRLLANQVDEKEWEHFKGWISAIYEQHAPLGIIASGGNINKIHKLIGKREGERLSYPEIKVLYDMLSDMTFEERILNYKLNPYRADVIIPALKIYMTAARLCKTNEIHVSKSGLADGIVYHLYMQLKHSQE